MSGVGCIDIDGERFAPGEARVSVLDRGFWFGDGVFETIRVYERVPFRLAAHLARLARALDALGFAGAPGTPELEHRISLAIEAGGLSDAYLRVMVTRGHGIVLDPSGCDRPTVVVAVLPLRPYAPELYERGIAATWLWQRSRADQPPITIKTTSYQLHVLARAELARRGFREGFFTDHDGHVLEGVASNVFAVVGGRLRTPPDDACLPGITRAEVLALAAELSIENDESPLPAGVLARADEVFVTSSLAELLPVTTIDGAPVGHGIPGPITVKLHAAYRRRTLRAPVRP